MTDKWTFRAIYDDGTGYVTGTSGHSYGPRMSPQEAQDIVDSHNRSLDGAAVEKFRSRAEEFVQKAVRDLIDPEDQRTTELYWPLIILLEDTIVALFEAATVVQNPLVRLKDDSTLVAETK